MLNLSFSVAFCFYNISSIVNGLVYFDQFSLLSTLHLCLVMVGMVVLLAGVWIVSLPPGGEVDVGSWDEECRQGSEGDEAADEDYEDEPLPMVPQRPTLVEPSSPTLNLPSGTNAQTGLGLNVAEGGGRYGSLHVKTSPNVSHARRRTEPTLEPRPTSPPVQRMLSPEGLRRPRPRATTTLPASSSVPGHMAHQHLIPQRQSSQSITYPFPLTPNAGQGTLGGGFSIGLSPMSPGFALMPRRRRRRTGSGAGDSLASPPADQTSFRGVGRGLRDSTPIRRVVSDGNGHSPPLPSSSFDGERSWLLADEGQDSTALRSSQSGHAQHSPGEDGRQGRGRWRMLKGLFSFGR